MLTILPAPAGYNVHFDHPQRLGIPETYWIVGIGNAISIVFFAQRLYTKVFVFKKLNWDDVFFVLSWACCVTVQVSRLLIARRHKSLTRPVQILCCHLYASGSMGVHAWEMPITKYSQFSLVSHLSSTEALSTCLD